MLRIVRLLRPDAPDGLFVFLRNGIIISKVYFNKHRSHYVTLHRETLVWPLYVFIIFRIYL